MAFIRELGYRKVYAKWVPKILTLGHKTAPKKISEILQRSEEDGHAFVSKITTGDESQLHHYDPLTKRQSKE
jgi:hypothetical protein